MRKSIFLILILFSQISESREGRLLNMTGEDQFCFNNVSGLRCVEKVRVGPNSICEGDAMGNDAAVFKVPDRTLWTCEDGRCTPQNGMSLILMNVAIWKKGGNHYGRMSMSQFETVMGRPVCDLKINPNDSPIREDDYGVPIADPANP